MDARHDARRRRGLRPGRRHDAAAGRRRPRVRDSRRGSGIAAYAARTPGGRVEINTTAGAWGFEGSDVSPGFVAMAGYVLAWRRAGGLELQFEDGYPARPARPLLRGRVTVDVYDGFGLRAPARSPPHGAR